MVRRSVVGMVGGGRRSVGGATASAALSCSSSDPCGCGMHACSPEKHVGPGRITTVVMLLRGMIRARVGVG